MSFSAPIDRTCLLKFALQTPMTVTKTSKTQPQSLSSIPPVSNAHVFEHRAFPNEMLANTTDLATTVTASFRRSVVFPTDISARVFSF